MSNKTDKAWEKLFIEHKILSHLESNEQFVISADQIRVEREPRLMAKFDHHVNLPEIFRQNNLSILPISRKEYVITSCEAYHKFDESNKEITQLSLPRYLQSLDVNNVPSEAISLNCAFASGMLADFLEEEALTATVSGRMSSGTFDFSIYNNKYDSLTELNVTNSQIEIDAAYEGVSSLAILEAKRDISEDFLIRQLYYPYRLWSSRVSKPVRPVYLVFSNGIYTFYEYTFSDPNVYNSLRLISQKNYCIEDTEISLSDIEDILENTSLISEPESPFPQANVFKRIVNLCERLEEVPLTKSQITENYDFDERQSSYYTSACLYLGLAKKTKQKTFKLTKKGDRIMGLPYRQRQLELCASILEHDVFRQILARSLDMGSVPPTTDIIEVMKQCNLYNMNGEATYYRRSSTITGWINWILDLVND